MRLRQLTADAVKARLAGAGLGLDLGAARVCIRSDLDSLAAMLQRVYGEFDIAPAPGLFDVTADLRRVRGVRRFVRPQVELWIDGAAEFERFPSDTPLPLLEWGINYALAARLYGYVLLHAGAIARGTDGVLVPAMPGSGKSTLTAALARSGYRLLSDEFGVVRAADQHLLALLRPIALKNDSIDIIRNAFPEAVFGPVFPKTRKGRLAHLAPRAMDTDVRHVPVAPRLIVFPLFEPGAPTQIEPVPPSRAFARMVVNSFNFDVLGPVGFDALADLAARAPAFEVRYGSWSEGVVTVNRLLDGADADAAGV